MDISLIAVGAVYIDTAAMLGRRIVLNIAVIHLHITAEAAVNATTGAIIQRLVAGDLTAVDIHLAVAMEVHAAATGGKGVTLMLRVSPDGVCRIIYDLTTVHGQNGFGRCVSREGICHGDAAAMGVGLIAGDLTAIDGQFTHIKHQDAATGQIGIVIGNFAAVDDTRGTALNGDTAAALAGNTAFNGGLRGVTGNDSIFHDKIHITTGQDTAGTQGRVTGDLTAVDGQLCCIAFLGAPHGNGTAVHGSIIPDDTTIDSYFQLIVSSNINTANGTAGTFDKIVVLNDAAIDDHLGERITIGNRAYNTGTATEFVPNRNTTHRIIIDFAAVHDKGTFLDMDQAHGRDTFPGISCVIIVADLTALHDQGAVCPGAQRGRKQVCPTVAGHDSSVTDRHMAAVFSLDCGGRKCGTAVAVEDQVGHLELTTDTEHKGPLLSVEICRIVIGLEGILLAFHTGQMHICPGINPQESHFPEQCVSRYQFYHNIFFQYNVISQPNGHLLHCLAFGKSRCPGVGLIDGRDQLVLSGNDKLISGILGFRLSQSRAGSVILGKVHQGQLLSG